MRIADYTPNRQTRARHNLNHLTPEDLTLMSEALRSHATGLRAAADALQERGRNAQAGVAILNNQARRCDRMATELNLVEGTCES